MLVAFNKLNETRLQLYSLCLLDRGRICVRVSSFSDNFLMRRVVQAEKD